MVWHTIPVCEFLLQSWENMVELPKFSKIKQAISKGLEIIDKWYCKVNDTDAFFICLGIFVFFLTVTLFTSFIFQLWTQISRLHMLKRSGRLSVLRLASVCLGEVVSQFY